MDELEKGFVRFLIDEDVLQFGRFTLKDGRSSPYFLNFGLLNTGRQINALGRFFADGIVRRGMADAFDILFGPAYKGIAIAAATAGSLYVDHGQDKAFAYNRKEAKAHGEGGFVVGLKRDQGGRVLILDDVFSGGKAKDEALNILRGLDGVTVAGIMVGADREEKNAQGEKESEAYARQRGVLVSSLVSTSLVASFLRDEPSIADRFGKEAVAAFMDYVAG